MEWAFADVRCYILQSRAITSLFPLPEETYEPLLIWFSFGAVQGLVVPITPIAQDGILHVFAGGARLFDVKLTPADVRYFQMAGERIWANITGVVRHPLGKRLVPELLGFIEPGTAQIVRSLMDDPRLGAGTGKFKFSTVRRLAKFFLPIIARGIRNAHDPEKARAEFDRAIDEYLRTAQIPPARDKFDRLANIITFVRERAGTVFQFLLPKFISVFGPSMGSLVLLDRFSGEPGRGDHGFSMAVSICSLRLRNSGHRPLSQSSLVFEPECETSSLRSSKSQAASG